MNLTIEKKRNRVFDYCVKTGCAGDCKLKNWAGKSKFLNDENCLIIEEAAEEELDKALELINNTKINPLEANKIKKHKLICEKLNKLYEAKNEDYGDSFGNHINNRKMIIIAQAKLWGCKFKSCLRNHKTPDFI